MRRTLLFLALILPFVPSSTAQADPVTITGGFLNAAGFFVVSPRSTATGTDGFRLETNVAIGGDTNLAPMQCDGTEGCAPGVQLSLAGFLDATDDGPLLETVVSLSGTDYFVDGTNTALLIQPAGFVTLPAFDSLSEVTLRAPFTMTGFFANNITSELTQLTGRGTATVKLLRPTVAGLPGWERHSVRYDFESQAAVPEPSSMLLLGSGLAALVARARKRRSTPHT